MGIQVVFFLISGYIGFREKMRLFQDVFEPVLSQNYFPFFAYLNIRY